MKPTALTDRSAPRATASSTFTEQIRGALRDWQRRRRIRRTERTLEALSDRTLHDIGLDRSEITSAAREAARASAYRVVRFSRYY